MIHSYLTHVQFYEFGAFQSVGATLDIWCTNSTLQERNVKIVISAYDLLSSWTYTETFNNIRLGENRSTEHLSIPCPHPPVTPSAHDDASPAMATNTHSVVVQARLVDPESGDVLARYCDRPQPFRYTTYPDPTLEVEVSGERIYVTVEKPVKGLVLTATGDGEEVKWSDNALDVIPGDPQVVIAHALGSRLIKIAYMGHEQSFTAVCKVWAYRSLSRQRFDLPFSREWPGSHCSLDSVAVRAYNLMTRYCRLSITLGLP